MSRLPQRPAAPAAGLSALWVGRTEYYGATMEGMVKAGAWKTPPACDDPARLVHWAVQTVTGGRGAAGPLAFSLMLDPELCAAYGIPEKMPKTADTLWESELTAAGWKMVSRGTYGPWTVIQGGAKREIEIGICVVPWVQSGFRSRATHGIAHTEDGKIDPFGSMFAHAHYRLLTGWNLSGGAAMAGVKALRFAPRKKPVYWSPPAEAWHDLTFLRSSDPDDHRARSTNRPWHLYWTTPDPAGAVPDEQMTHALVWDQTAAYLTAWTAARFARGMLIHTGSAVAPNQAGRYPAGYYRVALGWAPELAGVVARLPPIHGSRQELTDGSVWVTHEVLDAIDHLNDVFAAVGPVAGVTVIDSWTCEDYGQIAKSWGEKVRKALNVARAEAEVADDDAQDVVAQAAKATYAQGYPLVERGGIMRRPDHVDAIIDHMAAFGTFVRLLLCAYRYGVYPLAVSADEVTMPSYPDVFKLAPLAKDEGDGMFTMKTERDGSARMATLGEFLIALGDGRSGRWWIEAGAHAPGVPRQTPAGDPAPGVAREENPLLSYMMD